MESYSRGTHQQLPNDQSDFRSLIIITLPCCQGSPTDGPRLWPWVPSGQTSYDHIILCRRPPCWGQHSGTSISTSIRAQSPSAQRRLWLKEMTEQLSPSPPISRQLTVRGTSCKGPDRWPLFPSSQSLGSRIGLTHGHHVYIYQLDLYLHSHQAGNNLRYSQDLRRLGLDSSINHTNENPLWTSVGNQDCLGRRDSHDFPGTTSQVAKSVVTIVHHTASQMLLPGRHPSNLSSTPWLLGCLWEGLCSCGLCKNYLL